MRPTFMGFESAKSAIFANQKSIDIVGNNIANIETSGYTRQRVDRASVSPSSQSLRVTSNRIGLAGQGVSATGISQMRDSFLDKRFRDEYAKTSYHSQSANILSDIQSALGDGKNITDEAGLHGAIKQIYEAINDYVKAPTMDTEANLVLSAFKNITQVFQQLDAKLTNVALQQTNDFGINVKRTNDIVAQIANLNKMISEDATVREDPGNEHFRPNELLDQRNLLLDELASFGDISVTTKSDGMVDVTMGGHNLITGTKHNNINLVVSDDQRVALQWTDTGENVVIGGGALLASVEIINGRGSNVQANDETPQQGIPYYRDRIDTLAGALATIVNNSIPELDQTTNKPKIDAEGNIIYKTLLSSKTPSGKTNSKIPVTAKDISISDEWTQGGAGYFIYSRDENVENYALKIAVSLTEEKFTFGSYGESFTGTFTDYEIDFLGKLASDLKFQIGRTEATAIVADDFLTRRDEISGVSQDEETADMLKYQKSYEAAARMMTVLDELLDVIINRMGTVGL